MKAELVGYLAASLTTVSFFPQAVKTLRSGDTRSMSLGMYTLFTSGVALWANLITLLPAAVVLQHKIASKNRHLDDVENGSSGDG